MSEPGAPARGSTPEVDLVVAVHTDRRAIDRAVGSVVRGTHADVRVSVVCHGVDPGLIAARLGDLVDDPRVRLLPFSDGIPSPAGPFNHGLDAATGRFTAVLGSDDELEPGAIDSWLALQRRDDAHIVIPRVTLPSGASLASPPTRPYRTRNLDGVRDRLAYRTAQLGLVDRQRFGELRFTTGIGSGEDVAYGLRLWFSGARIAFDRRGPGYRIHTDADDRTSTTLRGVADSFAFLDDALEMQWVASLTPRQRQAIAIKLLRTHVVDALRARFGAGSEPSPDERRALTTVIARILSLAPEADGIVSGLDRRLLRAVGDDTVSSATIGQLLQRRTALLRPENLISAEPTRSLHREAPLRFLAAYAAAR